MDICVALSRAQRAAAASASAPASVTMERKVEAMVTQHFLFLMSNVVSKRWSSRSTEDKIRAIQVRYLRDLSASTDYIGCLP